MKRKVPEVNVTKYLQVNGRNKVGCVELKLNNEQKGVA